eukprot:1479178-Rhodomonas_salina.1
MSSVDEAIANLYPDGYTHFSQFHADPLMTPCPSSVLDPSDHSDNYAGISGRKDVVLTELVHFASGNDMHVVAWDDDSGFDVCRRSFSTHQAAHAQPVVGQCE